MIMKGKHKVLFVVLLCLFSIIIVGYMINKNNQKNIYPIGDYKNVSIRDNKMNSKKIAFSQQQTDAIINILKNSDKKLTKDIGALKEFHILQIQFTHSTTQFYKDDNSEKVYYIIHKSQICGACYYVNSKELSAYLDRIFSNNI